MVSKIFGYVCTEPESNFIFLLIKIQQKNAQNTRTLILCLHWNTAYEQGETTWQSSLSEKWPFAFGRVVWKRHHKRQESYLDKKENVNFQIKWYKVCFSCRPSAFLALHSFCTPWLMSFKRPIMGSFFNTEVHFKAHFQPSGNVWSHSN